MDIGRALLRAAAFLALTLALAILFTAARPLGQAPRAAIRRLWCRTICLVLGIRWRAHGQAFTACPTLYVANHVSYLDILVLGTQLDGSFIAKAEVRHWPLLGGLARLGGTLFIRRHWRDAKLQRDQIAARMRAGESFILFAEGTSGDGLDVLPLKTALLSVAEPQLMDQPIAIQPVTMAYARLADGSPVDRSNAHRYAWIGDDAFLPHLWQVLKSPGVEVEIAIADATPSWAVTSRKLLGPALRHEIAGNLATLRALPAQASPRPLATIDEPDHGLVAWSPGQPV